MYISPRPSHKLLTRFYTDSKSIQHWNDKIFPASETARRIHIFRPRARQVAHLCQKYKVKTRVLLDVGAGFGTFGEEVKKLNLFRKVIAVEPSHSLAETCRRKGLEVIEQPIEKVKLKQVDVMTNFELIEHLFSPKKFFASLRANSWAWRPFDSHHS